MSELLITTREGTRAGISSGRIDTYADRLRGELILAGHPAYEQARRVWNGNIDRRPALIARCLGVADVMASVTFAREHDMLVAIRSGAHNAAGYSTCDGGLVIDLSHKPEKIRASFGDNYDRLSALKRQYDPMNFFRLNANIAPA